MCIAALVDEPMQEHIVYVFYNKDGLRPVEKLWQMDKDWDIEGMSATIALSPIDGERSNV